MKTLTLKRGRVFRSQSAVLKGTLQCYILKAVCVGAEEGAVLIVICLPFLFFSCPAGFQLRQHLAFTPWLRVERVARVCFYFVQKASK